MFAIAIQENGTCVTTHAEFHSDTQTVTVGGSASFKCRYTNDDILFFESTQVTTPEVLQKRLLKICLPRALYGRMFTAPLILLRSTPSVTSLSMVDFKALWTKWDVDTTIKLPIIKAARVLINDAKSELLTKKVVSVEDEYMSESDDAYETENEYEEDEEEDEEEETDEEDDDALTEKDEEDEELPDLPATL